MSKFITDIAIGGYLPGDSILHRLDPRTKMLGLVVMLVMVFWYRSFAGATVIAFGIGLVAYFCGVGWKIWTYQMRRFKWMLLIAAGLNLFFNEGGEPLKIVGFELPFAAESVKSSLLICVQLIEAIMLSMTLTFTTSPTELTKGFERLARPLKYLKVPVAEISLIMLLAMRFVPLLQQELQEIIDAQKSRGVEFGQGTLLDRAREFISILSPVLSGTIRRADLLAVAMSARGFSPGEPRSEYKPLRLGRTDALAAAFLSGLLVCWVFC